MSTRTPTRDKSPTGFADTPRQDSQRPRHGDHADAGGQESTNSRAATTQIEDTAPPQGANFSGFSIDFPGVAEHFGLARRWAYIGTGGFQ